MLAYQAVSRRDVIAITNSVLSVCILVLCRNFVFAASEGPDGTGIARYWSRVPRRPIIGTSKIDRNATRTREGFTVEMDRGISRRRMLAMSAAAGGVALGGDVGRAFAQTDKRIEQLAPELDKIIATSEPIKELATGFGGPLGPAEGPLWWKEGGFLLFTDIHNSRRMKHVPGQAPTVDLEPSNRANGLTRDLQGRLLSCEHDTRRVTRRELDGSLTVLANSFQGRRLNRPNDVVVKSDGAIYFTDPWSSPAAPEQWDLTFSGVYRLTPDLGTLSLLVDNFVFPNGLAFTPDESVLYVNDTRRGHIRAFDVLPNGTLAKQSDRVFADLRGSEPGVPDGMKVDVAGNVYCGGAGGIWILDPQGKKLGRIVHGHPATTNIAFGGDDWKTLYFTSRTHLGSVNLKVAGLPVPAPKKTG
jgi:gluconolactonase